MEKKEETVFLHSDLIKLDQLLKFAGAVMSGGEAKEEIAAGKVFVNGELCLQRGKKLYPGDTILYGDTYYQISREQAD